MKWLCASLVESPHVNETDLADIERLIALFSTHLIAAGVLGQIVDNDEKADDVFSVSFICIGLYCLHLRRICLICLTDISIDFRSRSTCIAGHTMKSAAIMRNRPNRRSCSRNTSATARHVVPTMDSKLTLCTHTINVPPEIAVYPRMMALTILFTMALIRQMVVLVHAAL